MEADKIPHDLVAWDLGDLPAAMVRLDALRPCPASPRSGENLAHVRVLAGTEDALPPVLVHRPTMRVFDGMHRLLAARLRGDQEIETRFFDGDQASAFVLAVQTNVRHGLPLSLADRKAAAARILAAFPRWSDRMIASTTGLAPRTIAHIRRCPTAKDEQSGTRIGRDGRARPADGARRHLRAEISAGAARPGRGEPTSDARPAPYSSPRTTAQIIPEGTTAVRALRADPSFRSSEGGRLLLQMLSACQLIQERAEPLLDTIPAHCFPKLAQAARANARVWQDFADRADQQRIAW